MKYKISFLMLFLIVLQSVGAIAQPRKMDKDSKQIYRLVFDHLKENTDKNYMEKIQVERYWIKEGQDFLYEIQTQPIGKYILLDDWKFVLKIDTNHYIQGKEYINVKSKMILGKDIKLSTAPYWHTASPIIFNDKKDKAYFYFYTWLKADQIWGPVLFLFAKEKEEWKYISESLSPISN